MVDINKYLESQIALAKHKIKITNIKRLSAVSEKSKRAAELISKKEDNQFLNKSNKAVSKNNIPISKRKCNNRDTRDADSESEYLLSSGEDDDEPLLNSLTSSRSQQTTNKIIDDGDNELYTKRICDWREKLQAAGSGTLLEGIHSADIHYILKGNKDALKNHDLQNGFCIPNYIWKQLYRYQRTGVKWLWELHQVESGGLLGDEMGLGKTVQIIAFLAGLSITNSGKWGGLGPSVVVAPATVIYQWVSHFHYWCPNLRVAVLHHSGSHIGNYNKLIRDIHNSHGILLITYAGVVKYSNDLQFHKWHYIILDEGHKIRNPDTQVSKQIKKFKTPHKIIITGSPMQNSLQELWSLFDFMRPGLLGTYNAFMEYFAHPITQGGYANATELQETTALEIAKTLKNIITPYMLRRTKKDVQEHIKLPEKNEQVLFCALTQEQRDLYIGYLMGNTVRSILDKESRFGDPLRARVLVGLSTLRKICNHPDIYLYEVQEDESEVLDNNFGHWKRCGKMIVVHSLLKIWKKQGHRALIFTQSRVMLCLLEQYLQSQEYKYLKMDGTVTISQRQNLIKTFNESTKYLVFLSTTRVGGLGVNLTGADRVIIYDPDWNPATDNQAKERAWRIGQEKNVTVYRLLTAGTIEEKIYQRQIFKHFLGNKILVDPNQKNMLSTSSLQGLFTLDELNKDGDTETASIFKHTKVYGSKEKEKCSENQDKSNVTKKKIEDMRRRAREISSKLSKKYEKSNRTSPDDDPRERYKRKRELLLNPPKVVEPEINTVDNNVTYACFENVMSELDIVNMHKKEDYEEKLIEEVIVKETMKHTNDSNKEDEKIKDDMDDTSSIPECTKSINNVTSTNGFKHEVINRKKRRRNSLKCTDNIQNLIAVKKIKKSKHKSEKEKTNNDDDDDYVLNKLFSKASVKNALQHDVVVGLSEKEKRYRMKEEASKNAKKALKAIKFSYKSN